MENNEKSINALTARLSKLLESAAYTASTTREMKFVLDELNRLFTKTYKSGKVKLFIEY